MKKFLITLLIIICNNFAFADIVIPKGSIFQVYPNQIISTMLNEEGESVVFINPVDIWAGDTKIIPVNAQFKGFINFLKLPSKGINGALGFQITEIVYPTGEIFQTSAHIEQNGQSMLGGDLTPPASYRYTIQTQRPIGWFGGQKGVLQYVPTGEYEFGIHKTIGPKDLLFIVLDEDLEF